MNVGNADGGVSWAARKNVPATSSPVLWATPRQYTASPATPFQYTPASSSSKLRIFGFVAPLKSLASQVPPAVSATRSISSCIEAQPVRTDVLESSSAMLYVLPL